MHILRKSYEIFVYQHNSGRESSFTATGNYIYIFSSCGIMWMSFRVVYHYVHKCPYLIMLKYAKVDDSNRFEENDISNKYF